MAWNTEMLKILRNNIGDIGECPRYSDDELLGVLMSAARLVQLDADFATNYVISSTVPNIVPDPTASNPTDDWFIDLTCAKACCLLDHGQARVAVKNTGRVRDQTSEIDLTKQGDAAVELLKNGWCALYTELLERYRTVGRVTGTVVSGPVRVWAGRYPYVRQPWGTTW